MACVTSPRAKIRPSRTDFYRGIVDLRGGSFSSSQSVCAIAGDTSEDPAGTPPTFWGDAKNWAHQRHAVEWFEAQRHHHCPRDHWHECQLSGSEKLWAANCLLFSFLQTARDQGGHIG